MRLYLLIALILCLLPSQVLADNGQGWGAPQPIPPTSAPTPVTPRRPAPWTPPRAGSFSIGQRLSVRATAYPPLPECTDETPFENAAGKRVRWGTIASNDLPLYTVVKFPSLYGDQTFQVEDRMNTRYTLGTGYNATKFGQPCVDFFMWSKADCLAFGEKYTDMVIVSLP